MEKTGNYNYSIAFMKAFFSFCVICAHFYVAEQPEFYPSALLIRLSGIAAPVFFMISLFLTSKKYEDKDISKIGKRLWRLYLPQIVWAFIYYLGYKVVLYGFDYIGIYVDHLFRYGWEDLLWQIGFGSDRGLCPQFWYQFDLIVITVLCYLVFRLAGKHGITVMTVIGVFALIMQYSGLNYFLFCRFEYELWYPLGRLAEVIPFAVIALHLGRSGILNRNGKFKVITAVLCVAVMVAVTFINFIPDPKDGFSYGGINKFLYGVCTFVVLYLIPFGKLPEVCKKVLAFLAKYSFGVFCIHMGLGYCTDFILCPLNNWRSGTFIECVIVYFVSLLLAWLISLIPIKLAKQIVT